MAANPDQNVQQILKDKANRLSIKLKDTSLLLVPVFTAALGGHFYLLVSFNFQNDHILTNRLGLNKNKIEVIPNLEHV